MSHDVSESSYLPNGNSLKRLDYAATVNQSLLHLTTMLSVLSAKKTTTSCVTYDPPQLNLPVGFYRNKVSQIRV